MKHFTLEKRKILEKLLREGNSYRDIAKVIDKSISSISDEIKRNSILKEKQFIENKKIFTKKILFYDSYEAEKKAKIRDVNKGKNKRSKLEISQGLKNFVIDKLKEEQWSPEQISGYLKNESGGAGVICHETIYQFIYSEEGRNLKLWQNLRHNHNGKRGERINRGIRKRRKNKVRIPNRTSIHNRLEIINGRKRFGDYEGDLMVFSNSPKTLAVFVERKTRRFYARVNDNKTSDEMKYALDYLIESVGQVNLKTITFDNGTENVCHEEVRRNYGYCFDTYFCDPYSSWQKGAVENINKLLRQYFPRSMSDRYITQEYLDFIVDKINRRPRKCLGFKSSDEEFKRNLYCSV